MTGCLQIRGLNSPVSNYKKNAAPDHEKKNVLLFEPKISNLLCNILILNILINLKQHEMDGQTRGLSTNQETNQNLEMSCLFSSC